MCASKTEPSSLLTFFQTFPNEEACLKYMEHMRFRGKPYCLRCNHDKVYKFSDGRRYKCAKCRKQFTMKVGTIFEDSKLSMQVWFAAIYLATSRKKGVSSVQLTKDMGITQKTAWFVLHRIREILKSKNPSMLFGTVEVDETYVGGKAVNKHADKKEYVDGKLKDTKKPVVAMLQRGREVRTKVLDNVNNNTIANTLITNIRCGANVMTDQHRVYHMLTPYYNHDSVNHGRREYVDGLIYTNSVEGFFSLCKRSIYGIYHWFSNKHMQRYFDEFSFRYNTRQSSDYGRFQYAIAHYHGRLKYKDLIAKGKSGRMSVLEGCSHNTLEITILNFQMTIKYTHTYFQMERNSMLGSTRTIFCQYS